MTRRSLLCAAGGKLAAEKPSELLARAVTFDDTNHEALRSYVWNSEEITTRNGKQARQQKYEINMVSGEMYWRKIEHNHAVLAGEQADFETLRLREHLAAQRTANEARGTWRFERAYLEELPRLHKAEKIEETTDSYIVRSRPNKNAASRHPFAHLLLSFELKLWLHKTSLHWTKAEWRAVRPVKWVMRQLPLGRLSMVYSNNIVFRGDLRKGDRMQWSLQRLPDGIWALDDFYLEGGATASRLRYYNYRKFASESELITH